jgi:hypothetical protein
MGAEQVADAIRDAKPAGEARPNGHDRRAGERRIRLVPFDEMRPILSGVDLVDGVLPAAGTSTVLGDPGCGKTFAMIDVALHVAAGMPWMGRRVKQGPAVYVAAEAGRSIFKRVEAWRQRHRPARPATRFEAGSFAAKVAANTARQRGNGARLRADQPVPFYAVAMQLNLIGEDDLVELVDAIRDQCGSGDPVLIVIDTVSRVMAGGNENSSEDMGSLIAAADHLRDEFDAHVCLVHHFGKDQRRGGRGWSGLRAAVDTEIEVSRDENTKISTAKIDKQRDGEIGEKIHFALDVVTIGENEETGEPVTSCVVVAPDAERVADAEREAARGRKLTRGEQIALNALCVLVETEGETPPSSAGCPSATWVREERWRTRCYRDGISRGEPQARRKAFHRASDGLLEEGLIGREQGYAWPCT